MDVLEGLKFIDLETIGFVGLFTFGIVAAVNFKYKLKSLPNFLLSVAVAFALGFVPADWGSFILNRLRDAIYIAGTVNGGYQFASGVSKKLGTAKPEEKNT